MRTIHESSGVNEDTKRVENRDGWRFGNENAHISKTF